MKKEVKRLLAAKIIMPLRFYNWVANLVPVRKKGGEIRICVYFTNFNNIYLKYN